MNIQSKLNRRFSYTSLAKSATLFSALVAGVVGITAGRAEAATYYWDGNDGTSDFGTASGMWAAPTVGTTTSGWSTDSSGATVVNGNSVTTATADGINFGNGVTGLGAGTITVSGTVSAGNMTFASGSGAIVLSGGTITLTPAETITVDNGTNTISSILAGAATSLLKAGNGTLTLSGANTHSGTTTISAGTLKLQGANMWKTARTYTINGGAVLHLDGGVNFFTSTAATTTINGTGTLRLTNGTYKRTNTTGATVVLGMTGGTIDIQSGATLYNGGWTMWTWTNNKAHLNVDGTLDVADATVIVDALKGTNTITKSQAGTHTLTVGQNNGTGTFSGVIQNPSGTLALTKTGTGTQTLSGNSTYSGVTTISGGILAIAHNNALGNTTGNTTIAATGSSTGPQLRLSGNITSPENISITGNSDANQYAGVIFNTSGTNTLSGNITLASPGGGIRLFSGGGELILGGTVSQTDTTRNLVLQATSGAALTVNNAIANNNATLNILGNAWGGASAGVTLKAASTAIGETFILENGTLKLGVTDAIKTTANLTLGTTGSNGGFDVGTFDLAGFNQTVNALIGTKNTGGTIAPDTSRKVTNSAASGTSTLTVGNGNGTGTFNGVILDGATAKVALTKTGTGTQTLVGESTYSGPTIILGGTLSLTHLNAMQYSPLDTANSVAGDATKGLKTNQSSLKLGGLSGNKDLASVFTTTAGGYGSVSTLTLNTVTGAELTYSGSIANGAAGMALTKTGAGSQTLSGANTYSGTTTVSAGKLLVNGSITGTVNVDSGAYLGGMGGAITGNVTYAAGAFGLFTNDAPLRFAGTVTLDNNVVHLTLPPDLPVGNYVLATNTTGGFSGMFATTPAISSGSFVTGSSQTVTTTGDSVVLQVTVLAVASKLAITDLNSGVNPTAGVPYSVTIQAQDAGGTPRNVSEDTGITLSMDSGTAGSLGGTLTGSILNGQNSATISGVTNSVAEVFTLQAATSSGMSLVAATTNYTIVAGPAAALSVSGLPSAVAPGASNNITVRAVDAYGNTITNYAGTVTLASTLGGASFVPASPYTFLAGDAGVKTFSAALDNFGLQDITANDGSLSGQQTGILVAVPTSFYWTNSASGNWSVTNNWTNDLGWIAAPVTAGQTNYTLNFNNAGATYTATNNLTNGFLLNQINFGGAAATLAGYSLAFTNNAASLPQVNQNSAAAISIGNDLILGTDTTFGGTGNGTVTVSGAMSGVGGLTKTGSGTLLIGSTNNTYTGATTINGGTLQLARFNSSPTSYQFSSDETSGISSQNTYTTAITWNDSTPPTINGVPFVNGTTNGSGSLGTSWTLTGATSAHAGGKLPAGFTILNTQGTYDLLNNGLYYSGNPAVFTLSGLTPGQAYSARIYYRAWDAIGTRTATFNYVSGGTLLGAGTFNEDATATGNYVEMQYIAGADGKLIVTNSPAIGSTTWHWYGFSNHILPVRSPGRLPATEPVSIASGATFDLNGNAQTVVSLSDFDGEGGTVTNSSSTAATLTINPSSDSTTFSGAISGPISLVKTGIATQILAGASAYTGPTTVNEGTLSLTQPCLNDDAAVSVSNGTVLNLGFVGADTVFAVFFDGVLAPAGEWGGPGSGAANTTNLLSGTGILRYSVPAGTPAFTSAIVAAWHTINLGWQDNATDETGYILQHSTNGVDFTTLATLSSNVTSYSHHGWLPAGTYTYRLAATNSNAGTATSFLFCQTNAVTPGAPAGTILYDSFELPDITGSQDATPPGWLQVNVIPGTDYSGMLDEDYGYFSTPYGYQVVHCWINCGYLTTSLTNVLTAGTTYTLTFNVGNVQLPGGPWSGNQYTADLMAGSTVVATVNGLTATANMSVSNTLTFTPVPGHANLGQILSVRLWMSGGDHQAQTLFDNVLLSAVLTADTTPPTPNPMGWYLEPWAGANRSIIMVASNAMDTAGVQYFFTNTVNGNTSGWISGTTWTNSGLTHGMTYTYKVKARDLSSNLNETGWSTEKSATADRTILLYESFETPIVVGSSANATYSPGWAYDGGAQNYNGLINEGTGLISTPYGMQVAKLWSGSLVKYSGLTNVLTAGTQYTVTFNAGNTASGTPRTDNICLVELLAGSTVLASASRTTTTDDMSTSGTFSFTPGSTHANLGQTVSVRIRMSGGDASALSLIDNLLLVGVPDTTPPAPDPMGFEVPPYGFSRSSIMMTASNATDATGPVQYLFTNDTAGVSSGWSTNRVWQNTGLTPNNTYSYRVKARDAVLNETAWSAVAQSETSPPQPSVFRFR